MQIGITLEQIYRKIGQEPIIENKVEKTPKRIALETEAQTLGVKGNISAMKDETLTKKVNELKKSQKKS